MLQYTVQTSVSTAAGDVADQQLRIGDLLHTNVPQVTPVKPKIDYHSHNPRVIAERMSD